MKLNLGSLSFLTLFIFKIDLVFQGPLHSIALHWTSLVAQLVKNLPVMWGDLGSIPGLGRSPGEGKGYPLQYPGLENSMDCKVHGVAKSWTQLSNFHLLTYSLMER